MIKGWTNPPIWRLKSSIECNNTVRKNKKYTLALLDKNSWTKKSKFKLSNNISVAVEQVSKENKILTDN